MLALFGWHSFTVYDAADWTEITPSNWLRGLLREMEEDGLLSSYWDRNTRRKMTQFFALTTTGKNLAAETEERVKWLKRNI